MAGSRSRSSRRTRRRRSLSGRKRMGGNFLQTALLPASLVAAVMATKGKKKLIGGRRRRSKSRSRRRSKSRSKSRRRSRRRR